MNSNVDYRSQIVTSYPVADCESHGEPAESAAPNKEQDLERNLSLVEFMSTRIKAAGADDLILDTDMWDAIQASGDIEDVDYGSDLSEYHYDGGDKPAYRRTQ